MIKTDFFHIVDNAYIASRLKVVYPRVKTVSLLNQQSTLLNKTRTVKAQWGDTVRYKLGLGLTDTGNSYAALHTGSVTGALNFGQTGLQNLSQQMFVEPRQITSYFDTNMPKQVTTKSEEGAFDKAIYDDMTLLYDSLSKREALHLYNGSSAFVGQVRSAIASGATSITAIPGSNVYQAMVPGFKFSIAQGSPTGALNGGVYVVQSRTGDGTIDFLPALPAAAASGDFIISAFAQGIQDRPGFNGPEGLWDILPSIYDRTGASWNTYINTPFRNLNRAIAADLFGGAFQATDATVTGFKWIPAFQKFLMLTKNAGARSEDIQFTVSPVIYQVITEELQAEGNFNIRQVLSESANPTTVMGRAAIGVAHGELAPSYFNIDSWAPVDRVYCVPLMANGGLEILDAGMVDRVRTPQGETGKQEWGYPGSGGISTEPFEFKGNIDNFFDIMGGLTYGDSGPNYRVIGNLWVNPVIRALDRAGVMSLTLPTDITGTANVW